jgi:surfeit locus 1 family protein
MNILGYNFRPKIWALVITVIFVIIFVQLGQWQLSRAEEKDQRQHQLDQLASEPLVAIPTSLVELEDFLYRQVEVRGVYIPEETIYLDNKIHKGIAGYHIITPVKLSQSEMHVLINRGWIATGPDRSILPIVPAVEGEVIVTGLVVPPTQRALELSDQIVPGYVWGTLYIDRYQEMTGLSVQPILIQQQDILEDGLIRQWIRLDSGSDRNLGYAMQWFSFAALALIIFLVLNVKRNSKEES